eukprot:2521477-Prymnesium_polylepis.1
MSYASSSMTRRRTTIGSSCSWTTCCRAVAKASRASRARRLPACCGYRSSRRWREAFGRHSSPAPRVGPASLVPLGPRPLGPRSPRPSRFGPSSLSLSLGALSFAPAGRRAADACANAWQAFAKYRGCYEATIAGTVDEGLLFLTGGLSREIQVAAGGAPPPPEDRDALWAELMS